jgi:hypothetical protein
VKKAIQQFGTKAKDSIVQELLQIFKEKKVLIPIKEVPKGEKILPGHMFCKPKHYASGEFEKLKSRLVGGGNFVDYSTYELKEISSPTPSIETFIQRSNSHGDR